MNVVGTPEVLWLRRVAGPDGFDIWVVSRGPESLDDPELQKWKQQAADIFTARAEVASLSVIGSLAHGDFVAQATVAALPLCFLNGRTAGLLGFGHEADGRTCPIAQVQQWIETATLKGLVHLWVQAVTDGPGGAGPDSTQTVPTLQPGDRTLLVPWQPLPDDADTRRPPIALGIDAAWLHGGESGAQVFAFEMIREMVRRPDIARVVLLSNTGAVPESFAGVPKISGMSWSAGRDPNLTKLDILHRPYQPGEDVDYRLYHQVANCVAITVLDFIAYDNPSYHESRSAWRQYQRAFDEKICLADGVFAISDYVGDRLQRQFAHQLSAPVRSIPLGTDHLRMTPSPGPAGDLNPSLAILEHVPFLLVLGNDFEHKNRDFAVKVFRDMRARGYDGRLVLAGFHLDGGSSFDHELRGADDCVDRIVRIGAVSGAQKTWLLARAQAVLYPTSSEGFGLVPFEAAALGTPTAFVSFGPLRVTLRGVRACAGWNVRMFADHVFHLMEHPAAQLDEIRAASELLTWERCVDEMLDGYHALLSPCGAWQTKRRVLHDPGVWDHLGQIVGRYAGRAANRVRRLAKPR